MVGSRREELEEREYEMIEDVRMMAEISKKEGVPEREYATVQERGAEASRKEGRGGSRVYANVQQ